MSLIFVATFRTDKTNGVMIIKRFVQQLTLAKIGQIVGALKLQAITRHLVEF